MESFCPLCAKNGIKRRLKAFQINLTEAMWSCEAEDCCWPINYEELTFFERLAISYDWEEPSPAKEEMPALTELSLYTPPVTPGGELSKESTETGSSECSSNPLTEDKLGGTLPKCDYTTSKESADPNKLPLLESLQLESNNSTEESGNVAKEKIAGVSKMLPKIINIQKTNINFTVFPNMDIYHDNTKIQEQACGRQFVMDTTVMDISDVSGNQSKDFGLSAQDKTGNEQNKSDEVQSDAVADGAKTNLAETLSGNMKALVDVDVTNNLNTTSDSITNTLDNDLETLLDCILNDNRYTEDISDDWLNHIS